MLEKQIVDLKARNNQHRLEITALETKLSQMQIIVEDCSKKCEMISRHEEFVCKQTETNLKVASDLVSAIVLLNSIWQRTERYDLDLRDSHTLALSHQESLALAFSSIKECLEKIDAAEVPNQIREIQKQQAEHEKKTELQFAQIDERICIPFEEVLSQYKNISVECAKACEDSSKARDVAERIGVEIKVLNRKMKDILGKLQ